MRLQTENLTKSFGEKQVLKGVSFAVESGRALGLLGRNGAGKTTTIRIIMQVFSPDSGKVLLDGTPLHTDRVKIGYLPEERGLYPKKPILEQLLYFGKLGGLSKKQAAAQAERLLARLGMAEYRDKRLDTLSKGNQQKIQLVATLITDPDIVILDEPFSGLDPVNAKLLKDLVKEMIAEGKLVLFSSHQMNYIEEFCNDIVILHDGKAVLSGDIGEIKRGFDRRTVEIVTTESNAVMSFLQKHKSEAVQKAEASENLVTVTLARAEDKAVLYALLADCADKIDAFRVKEPTLNEIFVHYTEDAKCNSFGQFLGLNT